MGIKLTHVFPDILRKITLTETKVFLVNMEALDSMQKLHMKCRTSLSPIITGYPAVFPNVSINHETSYNMFTLNDLYKGSVTYT